MVGALFLLSGMPAVESWILDLRQNERAFASLTAQADNLVIHRAFKGYRHSVIYRSRSKDEVREFAKSTGGIERTTCFCSLSLEVELRRGQRTLGSVWLDGSMSMAVTGGVDRVAPKTGGLFAKWFEARGIPELWDSYEQIHIEPKRALERWHATQPESLRTLWVDPLARPPAAKDLLRVLQRKIPDPSARIRALLAWYGSKASDFEEYDHDSAIAEMLLLHGNRELRMVLRTLHLSDAEATGAARLVAIHGGRGRPDPLAAMLSDGVRNFLVTHTQNSGLRDSRGGRVYLLRKALHRYQPPIWLY